jgi:RNA polymerase-binding transcription factor DksA
MSHTTDAPRADGPLLDPADLARLRTELLARRAAQAPLVAEHEATVAELTGQGDVDSILERELADASITRARAMIGEVDAALARMDDGTYGACGSCGGAIPVERLEAIPHTRTCVHCPS